MVTATWHVLLELAPWLLLGAGISALLHVLLPDGFVHRHLQGRSGVFKAVALGVPLPLCSCGVIPAGLGLKRDGASDGASVAFLVSTPQTGVDSVLVAASFLGWPFALYKVAAAAITGVVAGSLVDATAAEDTGQRVSVGGIETHDPRPAWRRAVDHFDEVVGTIWGWLVFGVLVSAALTTFLPPDALAGSLLGTGLLAGVFVLLISLPLYVCATASVPIAAGLIHAGLPTGAALVFLMAGPATNVATVGAVHRAFGGRVLGLYLGTVAVGSYGLGLLFDALFTTTAVGSAMGHEASWVAAASAVVLLGLMARYAIQDLRAWLAPTVSADDPAMELSVGGMTCNGCARKVGDAVRGVDGVSAVAVDLDGGRITIQGAADLAAVRSAVSEAGFQPG